MRKTENDNKPGGIIAVNKPCGVTSHDVVYKMRKLFSTARVGHTGTLDPMATGVLVLLVGRAAKACEYISKDKKGYVATLTLGYETDTEDNTGNIINDNRNKPMPKREEVLSIISGFVGKITQIPPMYSALKVNGQKLCDLARKGINVEREGREIEIYSIDVEFIDECNYKLSVYCSGGTYIRTLCADIGKKLGCGGVMSSLHRIEASGITIDEAYTLEELSNMSEEERWGKIKDTETLFINLFDVTLPEFYEKLYRDGCPIYQKKINTSFDLGTRVRVKNKNGEFFSLGEIVDAENGSAVKSVKIFNL